jgi:hypothetical protein
LGVEEASTQIESLRVIFNLGIEWKIIGSCQCNDAGDGNADASTFDDHSTRQENKNSYFFLAKIYCKHLQTFCTCLLHTDAHSTQSLMSLRVLLSHAQSMPTIMSILLFMAHVGLKTSLVK